MNIQVKAVFPHGGFGFDGLSRRRHGDVFEIDEIHFCDTWMELVKSAEPAEAEQPKKRGRKPKDAGEQPATEE